MTIPSANQSLDQIFWSLLDASRGWMTNAEAWLKVLSLMTIRFEDGKAWRSIQWTQTTREWPTDHLATTVRSCALDFERRHPSLEGIFTRELLSDLDRLNESVLKSWVYELSKTPLTSFDPRDFGYWIDDTINTQLMKNPDMGPLNTPPSVAVLMLALADVRDGDSIVDPFSGSGTILATAARRANESGTKITCFGQEKISTSWALSRLRLFLLGQDPGHIKLGDTFNEPAFRIEIPYKELEKFDRVVCDGPIGLRLQLSDLTHSDPYRRFLFAPPGRASTENLIVQHALASMKPQGKAVILVPHGFLFRSGVEARVREHIFQSGLLQAVIGLPAKLLQSTSIPTALLLLSQNTTGQVLMLDASEIEPVNRGRQSLSESSILRIVDAVRHPETNLPALTRLVSWEELADLEFNLLPHRYVSANESRVEFPDPEELMNDLQSYEGIARDAAQRMDEVLRSLST